MMPRVGKSMDRKAQLRRMAESGALTASLPAPAVVCGKCHKPGHVPRQCKVTWKKAWLGQHVARIVVRFPDGTTFEVLGPLSEDLSKRLQELAVEMMKLPEPPETQPAKGGDS